MIVQLPVGLIFGLVVFFGDFSFVDLALVVFFGGIGAFSGGIMEYSISAVSFIVGLRWWIDCFHGVEFHTGSHGEFKALKLR